MSGWAVMMLFLYSKLRGTIRKKFSNKVQRISRNNFIGEQCSEQKTDDRVWVTSRY